MATGISDVEEPRENLVTTSPYLTTLMSEIMKIEKFEEQFKLCARRSESSLKKAATTPTSISRSSRAREQEAGFTEVCLKSMESAMPGSTKGGGEPEERLAKHLREARHPHDEEDADKKTRRNKWYQRCYGV